MLNVIVVNVRNQSVQLPSISTAKHLFSKKKFNILYIVLKYLRETQLRACLFFLFFVTLKQ